MNQNERIKKLIAIRESIEIKIRDLDPMALVNYELEKLGEPECEHKNTYNDTKSVDTYPVIRCKDCDQLL